MLFIWNYDWSVIKHDINIGFDKYLKMCDFRI